MEVVQDYVWTLVVFGISDGCLDCATRREVDGTISLLHNEKFLIIDLP